MRGILVFVAAILIATNEAFALKPCANFSPGPIFFSELPAYFSRPKISKLTELADTEEIRQILSVCL